MDESIYYLRQLSVYWLSPQARVYEDVRLSVLYRGVDTRKSEHHFGSQLAYHKGGHTMLMLRLEYSHRLVEIGTLQEGRLARSTV